MPARRTAGARSVRCSSTPVTGTDAACGVRLGSLVRTGGRALLLGLLSTLVIGTTSFIALTVLG